MRGFELLEQLSLVDSAYLDAAAAKPSPRRRSFTRWGAAAACAALLVGLGVWGASREVGKADIIPENAQETYILDIAIAPAGPDSFAEPGMKTIPGFEILDGQGGAEAMATYYILPWIGYGDTSGGTADSIAVPEDCTRRELTEDDVLALVGGETVLKEFLAWEGMEFSGSVFHHANGQVWELELWGESDSFAFSLTLAPEELPPACMICPTDYVTEIWGVEVAGRRGGIHGQGANREVWMPESREVVFVAKDVGCRFHLYGLEGESEAVETMVSRFVRHAILEGLNLSALGPDGVLPS